MAPCTFDALLEFDRGFLDRGRRLVGVDEAGRGPLAGPVVAAAVVFELASERLQVLAEVNDSKLLDAATRERVEPVIHATAVAFAVGSADVEEIDRLNILRATHLAMRRAVQQVVAPEDFVLVDGRPVPGLHPNGEAVVDGDAQSLSIAAAGILAKVARDRIMHDLHARFPDYAFDQHKGYATSHHRLALEVFGACPLHRRSFAPVVENLTPRTPTALFLDLRATLGGAENGDGWNDAVGRIVNSLPRMPLSESRLLGILATQAGEALRLPPRVRREGLRRLRDTVGPFQPADAPLFALGE